MTAVILRGDARNLPLADASVDLIVTSPPYFALRSYIDGGEHYAGQLGAEATPGEYVAALLDCTREWMRALKPGGSIFVNLGDKFSQHEGVRKGHGRSLGRPVRERRGEPLAMPVNAPEQWGVPTKSLMGLPWRYAIGCVDQLGLILRRDLIWSKPSAMPESVTDRCRSSHEYVFHLVKQPRYFAAVDEIREPYAAPDRVAGRTAFGGRTINHQRTATGAYDGPGSLGALPGSVWEVASQPFNAPAHLAVDHYAAMPPALARRIILGWSPSGVCTECGEGRRPQIASVGLDMNRPQARRAHALAERAGLTEDHLAALLSVGISDTGRGAATQSGTGKNTPEVYALADRAREVLGGYAREYLLRRPTGFTYVCACSDPSAPTRPALVVDPFGGTGTTAMVASVLGRTGVSVDLSADYCRLAQWRTSDPRERARALGVTPPPPVSPEQGGLFDVGEAS